MQAVGVAMLGEAYSQAVRVQLEAERGACAAAGLREQGPAAGDAAPAPVARLVAPAGTSAQAATPEPRPKAQARAARPTPRRLKPEPERRRRGRTG